MHDPDRVGRFVEELNSWTTPPGEGQRVLHDQYRELIASGGISLSRERTHGHFTASALLVDPERAQVLLVMHPRIKRWLQMGGHIEALDPSFREAAARECREESGYFAIDILPFPARLDRHDVPCTSPRGDVVNSVHWDVQFLAFVDSREQREITEDAATRWWGVDEPIAGLDHSVELLIDAAWQFLGRGPDHLKP